MRATPFKTPRSARVGDVLHDLVSDEAVTVVAVDGLPRLYMVESVVTGRYGRHPRYFRRGLPERLGGNAREDADDAYATFMDMGDEEFMDLTFSLLRGGALRPAENDGYMRALTDRKKVA